MLAGLVVTLGLAGSAGASSIVATWVSTSGAGVGVGTSTLTGVGMGDTAVLQINYVAGAEGVNAIGVAMQYDNSVLNDGAPQARCPVGGSAVGNIAAGICGTNFAGLLSTNSESQNTGGYNGGIQIDGAPPAGQVNTTFTFAEITFTAIGAGTTGSLVYRPGLDGVAASDGSFETPPLVGASITVVPEPGTIALVGLGLGALAFAGRRRR